MYHQVLLCKYVLHTFRIELHLKVLAGRFNFDVLSLCTDFCSTKLKSGGEICNSDTVCVHIVRLVGAGNAGSAKGAMVPPDFGRSVNPISTSTRGPDYAHHITTLHPKIFRPSYGPAWQYRRMSFEMLHPF